MARNLYKEICRMLKQAGFVPKTKQRSGNHEIVTNGCISLSVPRNIKSHHTANAILKRAGIGKKM